MKVTGVRDIALRRALQREFRRARGTLVVGVALLFGAPACFDGAELDQKEPPPGHPGGQCIDGEFCSAGVCWEGEACYEPNKPCQGFYCGGNGTCMVNADTLAPYCLCDPGYSNAEYSFYCIFDPESFSDGA